MFENARFRSSLADLIMDPGVPLKWLPYGKPYIDIIKIGIYYEADRFKNLPPKQRAIRTVFEIITTELVPKEAKLTLYTAALKFITKHSEFDFSDALERAAREYLEVHRLRDHHHLDGRTDDVIDLLKRRPEAT